MKRKKVIVADRNDLAAEQVGKAWNGKCLSVKVKQQAKGEILYTTNDRTWNLVS
jgi:hypothetical protein